MIASRLWAPALLAVLASATACTSGTTPICSPDAQATDDGGFVPCGPPALDATTDVSLVDGPSAFDSGAPETGSGDAGRD